MILIPINSSYILITLNTTLIDFLKNIETWSLDDMKILAPSLSSNEFNRILNNRSMDRSMLITDYIEQLEKEDEIQKGKTNNDTHFNRCP